MQTTPYVDALLADLESMAALGDEAVADAARRLSQTLRADTGGANSFGNGGDGGYYPNGHPNG